MNADEDFKNEYLDGEGYATAEEFLNGKIAEAQAKTTGPVTGFELSITNRFHNGLSDIDEVESDEDHVYYEVGEML